jgi:hypothetical protein
VHDVQRDIVGRERAAVLLYAGDFDPSGEDIERDFVARVGNFAITKRVALDWAQVEHYGLPPNPGKATDSRAADFEAKHGQLVQVEVDALAPEDLRGLFEDAVAGYWNDAAYQRALAVEMLNRGRL